MKQVGVENLQSNIEKLSSFMVASGRYIRTPDTVGGLTDYYISLNPEYILLQSNIASSRATEETARMQKKFGWLTIGLTGISIVFIAMSAILQLRDKASDEIQFLKKSLDSCRVELSEIKTSLLKINQSISDRALDTLVVRK